MKVKKTICNMCSTRCGIDVLFEEGKIVGITEMKEHPVSITCRRSRAIPEWVYSPERILSPLKKVNGRFREVSWDDALGDIASNLDRIRDGYGPKGLLVHVGIPFVATHTQKIMRRFSDLYGTPNYTTGSSFCSLARTMSYNLTCGGHLIPDFSNDSKCMVVWGMNPDESFPAQAEAIRGQKERGAKLLVIDPRRTAMASEADEHAQLRPGTDTALALGMMNVIISEGLHDRSFIQDWTVGFESLAEQVNAYHPAKVEEITQVPAGLIKRMARIYAQNRPASISLGISVDHSTNGIQSSRAVTTLMALTGNLDTQGGNVFAPGFKQTNLRVEDRITKDRPVGADYPLFTKYTLEQTVTPAIDGILKDDPYPIRAMLITGANPALTWPNSNKVRKILGRMDYLVVADLFMTETARMADVVLPGTTFLERQDLLDYRNRGYPIIIRTEQAMEPLGLSMEDWKMWAELGKRMGYSEYFPWKDTDELFDHLLKETGIRPEQLKTQVNGLAYGSVTYQKYLESGFNTPSGKVEIYSKRMADNGYDPVPTFHEPAESPISRPERAADYPLIMMTGPRIKSYFHSQYRNLTPLRNADPEPLIEIHPETADRYGVGDGETVKVESKRGEIILKTRVTEDILQDVVSIQHGWDGANANFLTDDEHRDPVSAYPGFRSVLCRLVKIEL